MHSVLEIVNLTTEYLKQKGFLHPKRQAEELVGEALGIGRMRVYLEYDRPLIQAEIEKCREWLKRRAAGEPLQYIVGEVNFSGCQIEVNSSVLIPRQETEILVEKIVQEISLQPHEDKELWDVCCGSGYIGIALKKKIPSLRVTLSDLSPAALATAKSNAIKNHVDVDFFCGDLLAPFKGKSADFFVCNPPYIPENEYQGLEIEVRGFEPKMALVSGETGLEFYKRLAQELPDFLRPQAKVWFEIGHGQGEAIEGLFKARCWRRHLLELDWSGRERFFSLEFE